MELYTKITVKLGTIRQTNMVLMKKNFADKDQQRQTIDI